MKVNEIREMFIRFFEMKQHQHLESYPLVPIDDPTLLWINAGITPLKKYFDGSEIPKNKRIVTSQKCIRTNDIDNVGYTSRHHTMFEMLGNFSIGDYFKKEAIEYAYEFLTSKEWLNLPIEKLYFTVYPHDKEAYDMWINIGIHPKHIIKLDGNFWEIGEGPCGPCSEIFYDRGEKYSDQGIELLHQDLDNDRYLEIWNLVFSQYNSKADLSRDDYPELPNKNIDTGMGLERIAMILQDVETTFETDVFQEITSEISKLTNIKYNGQIAFKIIADHIRTLTLAINDSVLPSNEGRGYVLRRLLRRAVKYGKKIGFSEPFMYKLVSVVSHTMNVYNVEENIDLIQTVIKTEEEKFYKTLDKGERRLDDLIKNNKIISGKDAFMLYDTYGYPIELTCEIAKESGVEVNVASFDDLMIEAKSRSRNARDDFESLSSQEEALLSYTCESQFVGYKNTSQTSKVIGIFQNGELHNEAKGSIYLILDKTPFYALSGGQVSDKGKINSYNVSSVIKAPNKQHLHLIDATEMIRVGDNVEAVIDEQYRNDVAINHSCTHLLNYALKKHFGNHVTQQGSYVSQTYLRFDFNHFDKVTDEDICEVEKLVNDQINNLDTVEVKEMNIDDAKALGAAAQFGEKYDDIVRVVTIGDSIELCGGTHVDNNESVRKFSIISFESKGSGLYRIEATTNDFISEMLKKEHSNTFEMVETKLSKATEVCNEINNECRSSLNEIREEMLNLKLDSYNYAFKLKHLNEDLSTLLKELDKKQKELIANDVVNTIDLSDKIEVINDLSVIVCKFENIDTDALKNVVDSEMDKHNLDLIFLANNLDEKVIFIAKASEKALSNGIHCGNLVKEAAILCEGNGGGRPNFAQAGGSNVLKIDEALSEIINKI